MLAWALLQGRDAADLLGRSPALTTLVARMEAAEGASPDARMRVAAAVAMNLGWQLFGSFIADGVGLDDQPPEAVDEQRRALIRSILLDPRQGGT